MLVAELGGQIVGYAKSAWLEPATLGGAGPAGWYLTGLVVAPEHRRCKVRRLLTVARLAHLNGKASTVWYFANTRNQATIALHEELGFTRDVRDFRLLMSNSLAAKAPSSASISMRIPPSEAIG